MTSSSWPSTIELEPRFGRLERQHAEVESALRDLGADLARRNAAHVDVHERMRVAVALNERQDGVHRGFVGADQHPPAAQVAEVLDRGLGLFREPEQPLGVVAQEPARVGQRGVLGGPVEQALADAFLEPPHRLADRRLGPVQLHGRPRKAPFGGHLQENPQFRQLHGFSSLCP